MRLTTILLIGLFTTAGVSLAAETEHVPDLEPLLDALNEMAAVYRDTALQFTCDETIFDHTHTGRLTYRFRYVYTHDNEGRLRDYRVWRKKKSLEPVDPQVYLPALLRRAYSWIFLFERSRRDHYRYEIVGRESALDRPAIKIVLEPVAPFIRYVNEWHATVWVDSEDFLLLRVEAIHVEEEFVRRRHEEALAQDVDTVRHHAWEEVATEFGVRQRGIRFPSEATIRKNLHFIEPRGPATTRRIHLVRQRYDNYRFFSVDAEELALNTTPEVAPPRPPSGESAPSIGTPVDFRVATRPPLDPLPEPDLPAAAGEASRAESTLEEQSSSVRIAIVKPGAAGILHGPTDIIADVTDGEVSAVVFYLDQFPRPVCVDRQPPYSCAFDAGDSFQGRTVRAEALGAGGAVVARDTVETLDFPDPEQVFRRTLQLPVAFVGDGADVTDASSLSWTCRFGDLDCKFVDAVRLDGVDGPPVSIVVLIDVSGSVHNRRPQVVQALNHLLDVAPVDVEIELVEFDRSYRRIQQFTSNPAELQAAVQRTSAPEGGTCLLSAVRKGLWTLSARPGHRLLLVISDGIETCELSRLGRDQVATLAPSTPPPGAVEVYADPSSVAATVSVSRGVRTPIYIYRIQQDLSGGLITDRAYEGLARESGGRLYSQGDLTGLERVTRDLVADLEATWILDIDLPLDGVDDDGRARRLQLEATSLGDLELHYPEYWAASDREEQLREMLRSDAPEARLAATAGLRSGRDPQTLRALWRAVERETDPEVRQAQLATLDRLTAWMLLHGDQEQRRVAEKTAKKLAPIVDTGSLVYLTAALEVVDRMR